MNVRPKYPIYIISKGRHERRLTADALAEIGAPFRIVIEPQEFDLYAKHIFPSQILTLPFSNLGKGSIPARNWVWDHATQEGHERHWIMDDNIAGFRRWQNNERKRVADCSIFREAEDFVDQFINVPMAGFQYNMFAVTNVKRAITKPYLINTRVYSCILLSNKTSMRWRGRYNEDTDLSLRFLKAKYCTILFYKFLCDKTATMTMKGGNTDQLYVQDKQFDGRLAMAQSLQAQHPDVVTITQKWGRWQHHVNYKPFANNSLKKKRILEHSHGPT